MSAKSILVVGEYNVGKTVYGIQVYGRLRDSKNRVRLVHSPENLSLFEEGIKQLNQGKLPGHTPRNTNDHLELLVSLGERSLTLRWPDYGGEQVSDLIHTRTMDGRWQKRVEGSDAWLMFIRLNADNSPLDALQLPAPSTDSGERHETPISGGGQPSESWDANARSVELLQMLLFFKRVGLHQRLGSPLLAVVLSCWDELGVNKAPPEVLAERLPLLNAFLSANWLPGRVGVFGVSSLGGDFRDVTVRERFIDEGLDEQGYVIRPDGQRTPDLTEPVAWLLEQIL